MTSSTELAIPMAFGTTAVGSFPHTNGAALSERLAAMLDIPCWPQLPRLSFHESMYVQYSPTLPAVQVDDEHEKIIFDTSLDLAGPMEQFYTRYLNEDLGAFALQPDYAAGFFDMMEVLKSTPGDWAKGQVTGPISFGLTVTDQDLRASLYNELLADAIVKNMAFNARWQARQLHAVRPNVIIFVDEPYMAAFGSAFISLGQEQVIEALDELFAAINQEGALAGVHCCANTDWSVLLATTVNLLNLDAFGYLENLALYPVELRAFLDRGGIIVWGIVPNNEAIYSWTPQALAQRWREGMELIQAKAAKRGVTITVEELADRCLIAPSCGLGSTTPKIADHVLDILVQTGAILRQG